MKFNMKDWKKVADHPDHVQMRNEDGHELKIAKKALSPEVQKHMASLPLHKADGGGKQSDPKPSSNNDSSAAQVSRGAQQSGTLSDGIANIQKYFQANGGEIQKMADGGQACPPGGKDEYGYPCTTKSQQANIPGGPGSPATSSGDSIQGVGSSKSQNKANGGKIQHYASGTPPGGAQSESVDDSPDQIAADTAPQAPAVNVNVGTPPSPQDQRMAMRYGPPKMGDEPFQPAGYQPRTTPYAIPAQDASDPQGIGAAQAAWMNSLNKQPTVAPSPDAQANGQPQGNAAPPVKGPQAPQDSGPDQMSAYGSAMMGGVGLENRGIQEAANATGALGKQQAAQQSIAAQKSDEAIKSFQDAQQTVNNEQNELSDAIKAGTITPKHLFDGKTTGQQLLSTLGLMFTGAGSALTHRPDSGMQYLQTLMDNDLKAQQENQGNRLSLFQHYNDVFRNQKDASLATQVMQNTYLDHMIDMYKGQNASPAAQAQADVAKGQLAQKTALYRSMIGTNGGPGGSQDPIPQKIQMFRLMGNKDMADNMQSRYVPEAPGQLATVPVTE